MTEEYNQGVLRVVVSKICQTVGWQSIQTSALDVLVDILHRYLRDVSKETYKYTELYGRTDPNLNDIGLVFQNRGIKISNIAEYIRNVGQINCPISVPKYSNDTNSTLNFTQPSTEEIYTRPSHIYKYLPSIYLEEKYKDIEKQPPIVINQDFHCDENNIDRTPSIIGPIEYSELPDNVKIIMKSCNKKVPYDTHTIMKFREGKLPVSPLSPIKKVRFKINQKKNVPKRIYIKKKNTTDDINKSSNQAEILSTQVIMPPNLPPLLIKEPVLSEHEEDTIPSIFKIVETGEPMKDTSADNSVLQKLPVIQLCLGSSSDLRPISPVINLQQVVSNEMSNLPISTIIATTCSVKSQQVKKNKTVKTCKKKYIKKKLDQENKGITKNKRVTRNSVETKVPKIKLKILRESSHKSAFIDDKTVKTCKKKYIKKKLDQENKGITTNKRFTRNSVETKVPKIKLKILRESSSHKSACIDGEIPITAKVVSNSNTNERIPYNVEHISSLKLKISKQYSPGKVEIASTTSSSHIF